MKQNQFVASVGTGFTPEELIIILEAARIALVDGEIFGSLAEKMDLADAEMIAVREKLYCFMEGEGDRATAPRHPKEGDNTIELFSIVSRGHFVIPKKCPACKADLTAKGALTEWDWSDVSYNITSSPPGDYEVASTGPSGESFFPNEIRCAECNHALATADRPTSPSRDGKATP